MKIAELYADIQVRDGQFRAALADGQARFQGFAGGVTGLVGKIAAGVVAAQAAIAAFQRSTAFLGDAVMKAADLGETTSKNSVVFGSAGKKIMEMADELAEKFGIVRIKSIEAASSMGLIFKSAGMNQSLAADMSIQLVKLATDLSSFNNIPVEEIFMKLRSGLVGEAEPLRSLGVMIDESSMKTQALAMGFGGLGKELTQGEKIQARFGLILKQTTDAQGDLARTAGSAVNQLKKLSGTWEEIQTRFGASLLPVIEKLMPVLAGFATELGSFLTGNAEEIKELATAFGTNLVDALRGVHDYMVYLIDDMKKLKESSSWVLGIIKSAGATGGAGVTGGGAGMAAVKLSGGGSAVDMPSDFHPEFQKARPHRQQFQMFGKTDEEKAAAALEQVKAFWVEMDRIKKNPQLAMEVEVQKAGGGTGAVGGGLAALMQGMWGGPQMLQQAMMQITQERKPDFKSAMVQTSDIASQVTQAALSKQQDPIKEATKRTAKATEDTHQTLKEFVDGVKSGAIGSVMGVFT